MNNFNTDLMQILAQGLDINEFFRQQLEMAINDLLKSELTVFLNYENRNIKAMDRIILEMDIIIET